MVAGEAVELDGHPPPLPGGLKVGRQERFSCFYELWVIFQYFSYLGLAKIGLLGILLRVFKTCLGLLKLTSSKHQCFLEVRFRHLKATSDSTGSWRVLVLRC